MNEVSDEDLQAIEIHNGLELGRAQLGDGCTGPKTKHNESGPS